jgi:hypothetical protein
LSGQYVFATLFPWHAAQPENSPSVIVANVHRVTVVKLCCGVVAPSYDAWHPEHPVRPPPLRATFEPLSFSWIRSSPWWLDRPPALSHFGLKSYCALFHPWHSLHPKSGDADFPPCMFRAFTSSRCVTPPTHEPNSPWQFRHSAPFVLSTVDDHFRSHRDVVPSESLWHVTAQPEAEMLPPTPLYVVAKLSTGSTTVLSSPA